MKAFSYTAYTAEGKRRRGTVLAETEPHASTLLKGRGLFPTELSARPDRRIGGLFRPGRLRLGADLRAVFTRQLAVLLSADLPVEAALDVVRDADASPAIEALAGRAKVAVLDGQPLSIALDASGAGFPRYYIAAVRAGEQSGDIGIVLGELAEHLENVGNDRSQLATALIYPAFVAAVSLLVCGVLMVNVAPQIVAMFVDAGRPLPDLTRIVIGVSDWIGGHAIALAVAAAAIAVGAMFALRLPSVRNARDDLVLRLPVAGRLMRLGAAAQYLRTLALLIASRQAVLDAAGSAAEVLVVDRFRAEAERASEAIRQGESLSQALRHLSIIPPVARQLVNAGERSARLARMTERSTTLVEGWLRNERKRVAALLDPILMILVGGFVLVIVLSILLPIFDLQNVVTQ